MNQRELIAKYVDSRDLKFNPKLFTRDDIAIIEELKNTILSCERCNEFFEIKVLNFTVIDSYEEINKVLHKYYNNAGKNKTKTKRKDNPYDYINLNESDIRLLIVKYYIRAKDGEDTLDVIIAVPRIVERYYFRINGIMRSTLYQIVDGSTYNNNTTSNSKNPSVTLKIIFMAVRVYRWYTDLPLTNGQFIKATYYSSRIFNKTVPAIKYILAKYGYIDTVKFMGIQGIYLTDYELTSDEYYCIQCNENIYISVIKQYFDTNPLIQSFVSTIYHGIIPGLEYEEVFNMKYWARSLGADFNTIGQDKLLAIIRQDEDAVIDTYQKGLSVLCSFESIYDISTRESIHLPDEYKRDMYCIFLWMLREFNNLRLKENLDISIKKVRFAEYVASLYAMKIARGIYRIADFNKKATLQTIRKAIRTNPNYLLMAISKCKMVSYRNMTSDMDSMLGLKFTFKGVSGLGENSNQSIPQIYRSIHPSHLGHIDLDSSSDGNPGMTGTICPFVELYDGFFTDYQEPNFWEEEFHNTVKEYEKLKGMEQALIFEDKVLNRNVTAALKSVREIYNSMEQLIEPIIYEDNKNEIFTIGCEIDASGY